MKKAQAIARLKELQNDPDPVTAHLGADLVLCVVLEQLGLDEVVDEWIKVKKLYGKDDE